MATINEMYLLVESEDPQYGVDVTDQPVETGINLTDHVRRKPIGFAISGFIVGPDAAQIRATLIKYMETGELVYFDGRNAFKGLITDISTKHDYKVANGYSFTMSLKEIRIAQSSYTLNLPQPVKLQVAPVVSAGRKQTKTKATKNQASGTADLSFWGE
jgi:hypothetical protein